MFQFNMANMPFLRTRQALLIMDMQTDFLSPNGALPVTEPEGFAGRTLDFIRAFRETGAGDIIWIRSEFEQHRSLSTEGCQIMTSDSPLATTRGSGSRGRQSASARHEQAIMEADDEAFLSVSPMAADADAVNAPRLSVRPGTLGAEFPGTVRDFMQPTDVVITKTHYSAFAQGQDLIQLLRGRFITEMYVCGVLTNVSIYATALDAGKYGYEMVVVEDCCGYRSGMRHINAIRRLAQLTGSQASSAEEILDSLRPAPPPMPMLSSSRSSRHPSARSQAGQGTGTGPGPDQQRPPVRPQVLTAGSRGQSTGLSPIVSRMTLSGSSLHPAAEGQRQSSQTRSQSRSQSRSGQMGPSRAQDQEVQQDEGARFAGAAQSAQPAVGAGAGVAMSGSSSGGAMTASGNVHSAAGGSALATTATDAIASAQAIGASGSTHVNSTPWEVDTADINDEAEAASSDGESRRKLLEIARSGRKSRRVDEKARTKRSPLRRHSGPEENNPIVLTHNPSPRNKEVPTSHEVSSDDSASPESAKSKAKLETSTSPVTQQPHQSPTTRKEPSKESSRPASPEMDTPIEPSHVPKVSEPYCEGDTTVITDVLPPNLATTAFEQLLKEVSWAGMSHLGGEVPRRVAVQGAIDADGNKPVYRHPADESPPLLPFSPTVLAIKAEVEKHLGHPLNHVLIQHYRSGNDYISEHSDKTLDIVRGSFIANVSLGAQRTMTFRTKRVDKDPSKKSEKVVTQAAAPGSEEDEEHATATTTAKTNKDQASPTKRQVQRVPLPHNSLCRVGLTTNMRWLHGIRQDKRHDRDRTAPELAFHGERISLTFRHIGTYLDASETRIWGQGATAKTRTAAQPVTNGETPDAVRLLRAFGTENHAAEFDWEEQYGGGFDVLHMGVPKRFYAGDDALANMCVGLALAEMGVAFAKGRVEGRTKVRFEDNNDRERRRVLEGVVLVLEYLDRFYCKTTEAEWMDRFPPFHAALEVMAWWKEKRVEEADAQQMRALVKEVRKELVAWEAIFAGTTSATTTTGEETKKPTAKLYVAGGDSPSIADFVLWPVLHDMVTVCGEEVMEKHLAEYYHAYKGRSAVVKVLGLPVGDAEVKEQK